MKKLKIFVTALTMLALTACAGPTNPSTDNVTDSKDDYQVNIIAPKGAPSLAFYDMANDENFVTSEGTHIREQFGKKEYGMIVMEFYTGLRTVKQANSNYRLARILTGGNLYLVSRSGKTTAPTADDKVIAFGPGGLNGVPYLALRTLYPQVKPENIIMLADGSAVQGALVSGSYTGKEGTGEKIDVDYVVIPQPALAGAMSKLKENPNVNPKVVKCLRDKASEDTNGKQKWVLQAGLFVHETLYNEHKEVFDAKLAAIDANIDTVINNPEIVKTTIEEQLPNVDDQKLKFSCPTPMIPKVSKNPKMPNGFGFIPSDEYKSIDVSAFLTYLGRTGQENDFSNYMLER